jgi:broad-specificity NMP kinase
MKKLIIINGTPGSGKTSVAKLLNQELINSVWLDGDWCWMMNPFVVNDENKAMVESNIYHMLNNFINNSYIEYIIFNWVIGHDKLMNRIISHLNVEDAEIFKVSLICEEDVLRERMQLDGRSEDRIENSIERQRSYHSMDTIKLDTTNLNVNEVVDRIGEIIEYKY